MRMQLSVILALCVSGCLGPDESERTSSAELLDRSADDLAVRERESSQPEMQPNALGPADDAVTLGSGCSEVVFCDQPNSSIGTLCRQLGCTLGQAKAECYGDAITVCGAFKCPGRIIRLDGVSVSMCCPNVCSPGCPC